MVSDARATAVPRVAGSIPSLATISDAMIRNGFRVSPAEHPCPSMADPWAIGKLVGWSNPGDVPPPAVAGRSGVARGNSLQVELKGRDSAVVAVQRANRRPCLPFARWIFSTWPSTMDPVPGQAEWR